MDRNNNSKSKDYIEGTPQFVPVIKWYEFVQDMEFRFVDFMSEGNYDGALIAYQFIYAKVKPYIKQIFIKYKNEQYGEKLEIQDIFDCQSKLTPGNTDHINGLNSKIYPQINTLLMKKMFLLQDLIAKANLQLPLHKKEWKPAALAQDDFV